MNPTKDDALVLAAHVRALLCDTTPLRSECPLCVSIGETIAAYAEQCEEIAALAAAEVQIGELRRNQVTPDRHTSHNAHPCCSKFADGCSKLADAVQALREIAELKWIVADLPDAIRIATEALANLEPSGSIGVGSVDGRAVIEIDGEYWPTGKAPKGKLHVTKKEPKP